MATTQSTPKRRKVKLFKDGDTMGVQTSASTAEEFLQDFAGLLSDLVESGRYEKDWNFQLSRWLPQAFEITAKLKGYKADVQEERVIYAGDSFVDRKADIEPLVEPVSA